ncbi:PA14 domain-containing protein [Archangium sp.]|uniref:PA14 domain-containing protein n=1 Tax=Archangium sp. TaxID=1872627 RepID=UPI002D66466C|nr:PA14 domain-containing protein [Archangium sp.]HYO52523.1 PA14 domain-containing protein [Archangium sp.]
MARTVVSWLSRCVGVFVLLALAATPVLAGAPDSSGAPDAPSVPGQFLIKFRPGTAAAERDALVRAHGGAFFHHIERLDIDSAEFPALKTASPRAAATLLEALRRHPAVEYAEPNYVHHLLFTPNDPYANPSLQGSTDYQWNLQKTQAYAAWDVTQGSSNIVIAIVDTGIQLDHPDLAAKMLAGYDFIAPGTPPSNDTAGENHGTRVAGVAAAVTHNGTGVAGMCPQCRILPVRVFDSNGYATSTSITDGIRWAADQGARVFNLSFAGPYSFAIESAVNYAWGKGAFLSCAAGNDNTSTPTYPAALSNCFAVAASKSDDTRLIWQQYGSSYGTWVHVAAPGDWLRTTDVGSGYTNQSWTSIAAPNVAGLAGLLAAQGLTHQQIKDRICGTSDATATTGTEWKCGRINAQRAVGPSGNGLRGEYFSDSSLSPQNLKVTRTDAMVNFDWGGGSPDPSLGDVFSARWTGQVLTTGSGGSYTFYTVADDGVRLWINGQLVIDRWFYRTPLEDGATVTLNANQRYDIKMEFYDAGGLSQARLLWQPPGGTKGAIPQSQLFPATSTVGTGLKGQYYADQSLSSLKVARTDATVNFDWGGGSPDPSLGDVFSARWTGQVLTTGSGGSYTFYTVADDGVRLWVNGQLVIDRWFYRTPLEDGATVTLNANQRYDIKMEFYDAGGLSQARLLWQPPGGTKGAIPQSQLFPAP